MNSSELMNIERFTSVTGHFILLLSISGRLKRVESWGDFETSQKRGRESTSERRQRFIHWSVNCNCNHAF